MVRRAMVRLAVNGDIDSTARGRPQPPRASLPPRGRAGTGPAPTRGVVLGKLCAYMTAAMRPAPPPVRDSRGAAALGWGAGNARHRHDPHAAGA